MFLAVSTYCQLCRGRMAETSALYSLFAWLLEGFVLTACKKKNVMSSLHTKSAIDSTKTPFQLHDILSYAGSEITFIRQAPTGDWNIFMVTRWKMWSPNYKCQKNFPSRHNTKTESIQGDFLHENIPTPERSQESDSVCKGIKMSCSWNGAFVK